MPLNKKGEKILNKMKETYGEKKGVKVFHASVNAGKIKEAKGVENRKRNAARA